MYIMFVPYSIFMVIKLKRTYYLHKKAIYGIILGIGMGGIYVELLTDISFKIAPVSRKDAMKMILETKAGNLLTGVRGQVAADIDITADCIRRLGQLAVDFPEIVEIEINPLLVLAQGEGVMALDARAIMI